MKHITQIMAAGIALVVAGCSTSGLPRGAHVVGGGVAVHWSPPASEVGGTGILVEKTTGKTVMTKKLTSVDCGFDFNATSLQGRNILNAAFGSSTPTNAQYVLYYVPGHE